MDLEELQTRYEELYDIAVGLLRLEKRAEHYDYIKDCLSDIRIECQKEMDEIGPDLQKKQREFEKSELQEYWKTQF